MHETGHSFGLAHHCSGNSIMNDGTSGCNGGAWANINGYQATELDVLMIANSRITIGIAGAVLLAVTACGSDSDEATGRGPSTSNASSDGSEGAMTPSASSEQSPTGTATAETTPLPTITADVTQCGALIRDGWEAPEAEPDIAYDPSSQLATVSFGEHDSFVFDLGSDKDCTRLPDVGNLLARTQSNFEQVREEECRSAVDAILAGVPPERDGLKADLEKLEAHVREWCPSSFASEIEK
jgi:hypothetical protein